MSDLTHFDAEGRARMVDVSAKASTARRAVAVGAVRMSRAALDRAVSRTDDAGKGDVRAVAELAAVMGAKRTSDLIPLCHPLPLTKLAAVVRVDEALPGLSVEVEAKTTGPTGVEMEALTGASVACLTIYDMLKAVDRGMEIVGVRLIEKSGGASGDWRADGPA
ncbi:MAG: cyclic pyranopterin monophosphate synthase MoaC [Parvularculaceae bacterium]